MKQYMDLIKQKIGQAKTIVITAHVSPDGDAIGSTLGLFHFLKDKCEEVKVIVPNAFPDFLNWLKDADRILIYDKEEAEAKSYFEKADIIFCLDYNETKRTAFMKEDIDASAAFKIIIDHHIGEPDWQDLNLSTVGASSTCELVFDFLEAYQGNLSCLNEELGYCLYTGLLTDTGSFQYSATTPKVHRQAAALLETGVQADVVHNHINNSFNEERLQFFGFCIANRMKFVKEKKLAYVMLSQKDMHRYNVQTGGTEGLVNEPMKIADIDISVLFKEDDGKVKISFRSKRAIDISTFAHKYFKGGGHRNAAGGVSFKGLEETEADFLSYLNEFNIP
jgi:phosphoesterase RecJ-like protein